MENIAKLIDHTALGAEIDEADVKRLCDEARRFGFATVVVQPCRLQLAVDCLEGAVEAGTVAGFPFGAALTETKAAEAALAVGAGATDIDMVINVGWIKDGRWDLVGSDISAVVRACSGAAGPKPVVVKVIIEACLLDDEEKRTAALLVKEAGANFVKTSTGYMGGGANVRDVALLREAVGEDFGVKASGGIRTLAQLRDLVEAGANRIGTSAGCAIIDELKE